MNGSAPNCSAIGSQMLVNKKCQPNLCRASMELAHSSYTSRLVTSTTDAAKHSVRRCAISSPLRSRRKNARGPAKGPAGRTTWEDAAMLLNPGDGLHFLFDDFFREFRSFQGLPVVKARVTKVFCSSSWALAEPVAGLALAERFTDRTGRPLATRSMRGSA